MSGGSLPRTGTAAVVIGGSAVGFAVPMPLLLTGLGVAFVLAGAVLIRIGFRRRRPAGGSS